MHKAFFLFVIVFMAVSCKNNPAGKPQTALDTGREFIRASLDGNFDRAEELLLQDTQNMQLFERYKIFYAKLPANQKKQYKEAAYKINKLTDVNDSTSTINYSNSYMHKPMDIQIVKAGAGWAVDFKYTYAGDTTALPNP